MKVMRHFSVFMAIVYASAQVLAVAGDCRKTASVCVDTTPVKTVSGLDIPIAQVGGCWEYEDTYDCSSPGDHDYCAAISNTPACAITSSVCTERAADNACLNYLKTYRCGTSLAPAQGVVKLEDSHTIVYDQTDTAPCASFASNPSCRLSGKQCVEGPGTRVIDGVSVYKDCWRYKEDYNCQVSNPVNYCMPLKQSGCAVKSEACAEMATTGVCAVKEYQYTCAAPLDPVPTNVTTLDTSYTVVSDAQNTEQCKTIDENPSCVLASQTCVQGAETRKVNGADVYKDCWEWQKDYVCASGNVTSSCDVLRQDFTCTQTATSCVDTRPDGTCSARNYEFRCVTAPASTSTQTNCETQSFCVDGTCFDTSSPPDTDFAKAIAYKELTREATNMDLFKGEAEFCRDNPLANCCKTQGGGQNSRNDVVMNRLGRDLLGMAGAMIKTYGSSYVFSSMFAEGAASMSEIGALSGIGAGAVAGESFSIVGFQFAYAAPVFEGGAVVSQGGWTFVGFDPYTLIMMVVIMVIMEMSKCEEEEIQLAMKRRQGLCHRVGNWCSKKVLGGCWEKKEGWCCFPSKLGRIVQEQGRAQLGKSWGSAENPDCSGFTLDELSQLKFDQMDLSEFLKDINPTAKIEDFLKNATDNASGQVQNYYEQGQPP